MNDETTNDGKTTEWWRWILVLPASILAWIAADFIVPFFWYYLMLNESMASPITRVFLNWTMGDLMTIFASYLAATMAGAKVVPNNQVLAGIIGVTPLCIMRLVLTYGVLSGNTSISSDSPIKYILGTLLAFAAAYSAISYLKRTEEKN